VDKKTIIIALLTFIIGWSASSIYSESAEIPIADYPARSEPIDPNEEPQANSLYDSALEKIETVQGILEGNLTSRNRNSPQDWIAMDQIHVYNNRVVIDIRNPEWSVFTDTKSMDPLIDSQSNAIEVIPQSENDIKVGDIVAYQSKYAEGIITHRIIEIGSDEQGWYARLKGDNNERQDPGKVRFDQIKRVVVAIIY
jgi:signal peptidase I